MSPFFQKISDFSKNALNSIPAFKAVNSVTSPIVNAGSKVLGGVAGALGAGASAIPGIVAKGVQQFTPQGGGTSNAIGGFAGQQFNQAANTFKMGAGISNQPPAPTGIGPVASGQTYGQNIQGNVQPPAPAPAPAAATNYSGGDNSYNSQIAQQAAQSGGANLATSNVGDLINGSQSQNASVIKNALDFYSGVVNGTNPLLSQYYSNQAGVNANNVAQMSDQQAVLDRGPILTGAANTEIGNIENGRTPDSRARLLQNLLMSQNATLAEKQLQTQTGAAQALLGLRDNVVGQPVVDNYGNITAVVRNPDGSLSTKNLGSGGQSQVNPFSGLPYNISGGTPTGTNSNFGTTAQPSYNVTIPKGTLAAQNNNPGNLRYANQPGATQGAGGFAAFPTPAAGYDALMGQISLDSSRGMSLGQYITKYAPPTENNTNQYIAQASASLGVNPNTPLSQVDPQKLAAFQAQKESGSTVAQPQVGTPHPASGMDYSSVVNTVSPTIANNVKQLADGSAYIDLGGLDAQTQTVARIQAQALGIKALNNSDASTMEDVTKSLHNLSTISNLFSQISSPSIGGALAQNISGPFASFFQTDNGQLLNAYNSNRTTLFQEINALAGSHPRINGVELNLAANSLPTLGEFSKDTLSQGIQKIALTQSYLENAIRTIIPNYVGAPIQANGQYIVKGTDSKLYTFSDPHSATVFKSSQIQ